MPELDHPELFRLVLENLQTGVFLVDRDRKILFWNDGAQRITGYLPQDVVGRLPREHFLAPNGNVQVGGLHVGDPVNLVFRDGKASVNEVSLLHKEGYRIPVVLRTVRIRDSHGAVIVAAESFDINLSAQRRTRRHAAIAERGQLDPVACVPSKALMEAQLVEKLTRFAQRRSYFSVLLVEPGQMDHFAKTLGKGVVPTILRVIAHAIENSLRPDDLVGRWSGNQFVALLEGCKEAEVQNVGERIRKMIGNSEFEWWGDAFPLTAALGGAGIREGDREEDLLSRAQRSLQESITAGGDRVTVVA
jgi:diguanylate cyclase (GGDEF)-like protein/PAS domain S-box-containing protein